MARFLRIWLSIILLQAMSFHAAAHSGQEDRNGCHHNNMAQHHCHDEDGDVVELIGVIILVGAIGYVVCKWLNLCDPPKKNWPDA